MTRFALWLGGVLVFIGFLPVFGLLAMSALAALSGCRVHEGAIPDCMLGGQKIGGLLYGLGMGGWFMLVSLPIALLGVVILALTLLIALVRRGRRR
jgi:hypothetical protein